MLKLILSLGCSSSSGGLRIYRNAGINDVSTCWIQSKKLNSFDYCVRPRFFCGELVGTKIATSVYYLKTPKKPYKVANFYACKSPLARVSAGARGSWILHTYIGIDLFVSTCGESFLRASVQQGRVPERCGKNVTVWAVGRAQAGHGQGIRMPIAGNKRG